MNQKDYYNVPLPKLYHGRTLAFQRIIYPVSVSIDLNIIPLSTATITMPHDDEITPRYFVELFTNLGSVGMFRARNPVISYSEGTTEVEVESAIVELGDYFVTDKYETMMAPMTAISTVFGYYTASGGTFWQLNTTLNPFYNERNVAVSCDHESVLDVLMKVMEQLPSYMMTFDYTTTPWTLGFAKRGTTIAARGKLSRNVQSLTISYDDSEMCTRLWYQWNDMWHMIENATAQVGYGLIEKTVSVSSEGYAEEITTAVYDYLYKHDHPKYSIEVDAEDLSRVTGYTMDVFSIGKRCQLSIPNNGSQFYISGTIKQMTWDDVYGDPTAITLLIEEEEDAVFEFIHPEEQGEE